MLFTFFVFLYFPQFHPSLSFLFAPTSLSSSMSSYSLVSLFYSTLPHPPLLTTLFPFLPLLHFPSYLIFFPLFTTPPPILLLLPPFPLPSPSPLSYLLPFINSQHFPFLLSFPFSTLHYHPIPFYNSPSATVSLLPLLPHVLPILPTQSPFPLLTPPFPTLSPHPLL